jgi:nucleoside-diphosphate-sugar epimerase
VNGLNNLGVDIVRGDLLNPVSFASAAEDVDYVVHIAGITKAKRKSDFYSGNVAATKNILDAALRSKKILLCQQSHRGRAESGRAAADGISALSSHHDIW